MPMQLIEDKTAVHFDKSRTIKRSPSRLKKAFSRALRGSGIKSKQKPRSPADVVRQTRLLLAELYHSSDDDNGVAMHFDKMQELDTLIQEMKSILYGNSESEPAVDACAQLTREFFQDDTLRLLILCLPELNLEACKDATKVVANLQRQPINSRLVASEYLEANLDLMDHLIYGYGNPGLGLHYGAMLRECIRHQVVARYVLKPQHMQKFFDYMQLPEFDVAADATATFKELMTRHKSTVAAFLSENYDWFFTEFNAKLLESANYITRRQAIKILGEILLDRSNSYVMVRYVSSKDNLRILMNLLRDSSKNIQIDAFHVFKLFVANINKPNDIINILVVNKSKLLRFLGGFKTDKEDELFEADKAQVMHEIFGLEAKGPLISGELHKFPSSGELQKLSITPSSSSGELKLSMTPSSSSGELKLSMTPSSSSGELV